MLRCTGKRQAAQHHGQHLCDRDVGSGVAGASSVQLWGLPRPFNLADPMKEDAMGTLAWILLGLVAVLGAIVLYASTKPNTFTLTRSTHINAPAARIFPLIEDFREWAHWSPWEKIDPALERSYSGAPKGVGAIYGWRGAKAGQGRMEITGTTPDKQVNLNLDFIKPFKAHNTVVFTLDGRNGGTDVTWSMTGEQALMAKVISVFMSMDAIVGRSFDDGLAAMKRVSEAA